ncbi:hypothetical protein PV326_008742 [Microctonus aethiopoides]|nr:hypothetical protein PV326_008742 [Microctonus aethiopoides]
MNVINTRALTMVRLSKIHFTRDIYHSCKVLVVGGGTAGCTIAAKFIKDFSSPDDIIIVEPNEVHYYQPLFTLIGGGLKKFESSKKPMANVIPRGTLWLKDRVISIKADENTVKTSKGDIISYKIMIVAMGLQLYWDKTDKYLF